MCRRANKNKTFRHSVLKRPFPSDCMFSGHHSPPPPPAPPAAPPPLIARTSLTSPREPERCCSPAPAPPEAPDSSGPAPSSSSASKGKRGRPRKHAPKLALPPLYVFIRNLLYNPGYNPAVIAWVDYKEGCFKVRSASRILSHENLT